MTDATLTTPSSATACGTVLLTGGTGFIGTLIAAVLLGREHRRVVALVRKGWQHADVAAQILRELGPDAHLVDKAELLGRLTVIPLSASDGIEACAHELSRFGITEIVHCAGSMDYFKKAELEQTNIVFTDRMLDLARALDVERFVHISTAYSSGYVAGPIAERLHAEPATDPTDYTRTKRTAEQHVWDSKVPFLIIRPSIVIGDSQTGRYSGKPTGLYQYWHGFERLLLDHDDTDIHVVAPRMPMNFVHQDAFQNAFQAACRKLGTGKIVNLVSEPATAPTVRELCDMWLAALGTSIDRHYYDRLSDVPLDGISPRQRAFLLIGSVNTQISAHRWDFENGTLNRLKRDGLAFADATLETIATCQARFMDDSPRLRAAVAQAALDRRPPIFAG